MKEGASAIGPRLRPILCLVLCLGAVVGANSVYMAGITLLEHGGGRPREGYLYPYMYLAHVALGGALVVSVLVFGALHIRRARRRPSRRAALTGCLLFGTTMVLVSSGFALMLFGSLAIRDPGVRSALYWAHVATPLLAIWFYVVHRDSTGRVAHRHEIGNIK